MGSGMRGGWLWGGGGGMSGARLANLVAGGLRKVCFQCCFEDERRLVVTGDRGK